jgi:hypothetical protein
MDLVVYPLTSFQCLRYSRPLKGPKIMFFIPLAPARGVGVGLSRPTSLDKGVSNAAKTNHLGHPQVTCL